MTILEFVDLNNTQIVALPGHMLSLLKGIKTGSAVEDDDAPRNLCCDWQGGILKHLNPMPWIWSCYDGLILAFRSYCTCFGKHTHPCRHGSIWLTPWYPAYDYVDRTYKIFNGYGRCLTGCWGLLTSIPSYVCNPLQSMSSVWQTLSGCAETVFSCFSKKDAEKKSSKPKAKTTSPKKNDKKSGKKAAKSGSKSATKTDTSKKHAKKKLSEKSEDGKSSSDPTAKSTKAKQGDEGTSTSKTSSTSKAAPGAEETASDANETGKPVRKWIWFGTVACIVFIIAALTAVYCWMSKGKPDDNAEDPEDGEPADKEIDLEAQLQHWQQPDQKEGAQNRPAPYRGGGVLTPPPERHEDPDEVDLEVQIPPPNQEVTPEKEEILSPPPEKEETLSPPPEKEEGQSSPPEKEEVLSSLPEKEEWAPVGKDAKIAFHIADDVEMSSSSGSPSLPAKSRSLTLEHRPDHPLSKYKRGQSFAAERRLSVRSETGDADASVDELFA